MSRVWLRWLDVTAPPRRTAVPDMDYRVDLALGETIELLGYDLTVESAAPGEVLPVTLYWRALAQSPTNYRVTIQVVPAALEEPSGALVPGGGRPDLLSAWILLDSANRIEESYSSSMHSV